MLNELIMSFLIPRTHCTGAWSQAVAGQGAPHAIPPSTPLHPVGGGGGSPLPGSVSAQAFLASWGKADMGVGRGRVCARVSRVGGFGALWVLSGAGAHLKSELQVQEVSALPGQGLEMSIR